MVKAKARSDVRKRPKSKPFKSKAGYLSWLSVAGIFILATFIIWVVLFHLVGLKPQKEIVAKTQAAQEPLALSTVVSAPDTDSIPTIQLQPSKTQLHLSPEPFQVPAATSGLAPVIIRIPTTKPVVFLTIDDGVNKEDFELQMLKENDIKATLFLTYALIQDKPDFFSGFIKSGSVVENHSINHPNLSKMNYNQQKQEICGGADELQNVYTRRPVLFRPPGGDYNQVTLQAAADCGMKAVVLWTAKANGGSMQYQEGDKLVPGDIVLMHFRPEFKQDLQAFLDAAKTAGLQTELLEDWLQ